MDLKNISTELEAKDLSQKAILEILNNKNFLNPDKLRQEYNSYKKRQQEIDNEIIVSVEKQIDDIQAVKEFMGKCNTNLVQTQELLVKLQLDHEKDQPFQQDLEKVEKLNLYKKNVGNLIEDIKFYFAIKKQTDKMRVLFEEDKQNYEYIHYKLLTQTELRDNLIDKMKQRGQDIDKLEKEFESLTSFEGAFYKEVYGGFADAIELAQRDPNHLIQLVKIIQSGDKFLQEKNKPPQFKTNAIKAIHDSIDLRFDKVLEGATDVILILDKAHFTERDLIIVQDFVMKCFPEDFEIFKVYESKYRENIEKRVLPYLDDESKIKEQYGTPIKLIQWVNDYEKMLSKAGLETTDYQLLKAKALQYMPLFQDHLKEFFRKFLENCVENDHMNFMTVESITKLVTEKQDLIGNFPVDTFVFINTQIDILGPQLEPNQFIEFLRLISENLNQYVIQPELQMLIKELQHLPVGGDTFYILVKVIIDINNFHKCDKNASDTKKQALAFFENKDESYLDRIENIFQNEIRKHFKEAISTLQQYLLVIIFREIHSMVIPFLFGDKWMNDDEEVNMKALSKTLEEHLKRIKQGLKPSKIHYASLCKLCIEHTMNMYWEQLIVQIKKVYDVCQGYNPDNLTHCVAPKSNKKEITELKSIFSNYQKLLEKIQSDGEVLNALMTNSSIVQISSSQLQHVQTQFQIFKSILVTSKYDLNTILSQIQKSFQNQLSPYLLEGVLTIRDGIERQEKQSLVNSLKRIIQCQIESEEKEQQQKQK
ncbi:hypothetical protein ABPG72_013455 [Tetrahymena utriculariae]